ncbi:MAG: carboxypeptidase-like regulatory domain-containing protein [Cyclobacteriaceae bacterium]
MHNRIKLIALLLLIGLLTHAQTIDVSIDNKKQTVEQWLVELKAKSGVSMTYNTQHADLSTEVELAKQAAPVEQIIERLLNGTNLTFTLRNGKIIIYQKEKEKDDNAVTLSGYIKDESTGESLIGATLILKTNDDLGKNPTGVAANAYGFYSITVPTGNYSLVYSYVGYESQVYNQQVTNSIKKDIALLATSTQLDEIVIQATTEDPLHHLYSPDIGVSSLDISEIVKMPALLGEVDVIKSIQTLPGVKIAGEGSTNFFVRGGSADQNLILLDEAPVYNASHLMGFLSVFNPDAINQVKFYRSGMPARYGGRLSSLLDVRMKEGNKKQFQVSGGVGLTASRLTLEGPIKKEKSSFIVSARRTYADLFLKFSSDEFTRKSSIYFYDLNAKLNWRLNDKDKVYLSGYFGRDLNKFLTLQYVIDWGNATGTLRWNHLFNDRMFSNTTLLYSNYDYAIDLSNEGDQFNWNSQIQDYSLKSDFTYYLNPNNQISFGISSTLHQFNPGYKNGFENQGVPKIQALEHGVYVGNEQSLSEKLSFEYGLRYSLYQLIGPSTSLSFDANYQLTSEAKQNGVYKTYGGLEPRIMARYLVTPTSSVKVSYNRNRQYMQLLSNLSLGLNVFDIWFPSTARTKPQTSDLYSLGFFKDVKSNTYELSAEAYYKSMTGQVDYKNHAQLIMNRYLEGELRFGKGRAYGIELSTRKKTEKVTGWFTYSYSRSERKIQELNDGKYYPTNFDQPHALSIGTSYDLSNRWSVATAFTYATGRPVTLPIESYRYEGQIVPVYGDLNSNRLPDYHRMDLIFTLHPKDRGNRKNESYWTFGLYNVYDRHNAATAFVSAELEDIDVIKNKDKSAYQKLYLFGIIPSITYNFNIK